MAEAGRSVYNNLSDNANSNCSQNGKVIGDSAWQKRGYSSLNGVVTLISDGKWIDTEVLLKKCKQCERWEQRKDTVEYANWKDKHIWTINNDKVTKQQAAMMTLV